MLLAWFNSDVGNLKWLLVLTCTYNSTELLHSSGCLLADTRQRGTGMTQLYTSACKACMQHSSGWQPQRPCTQTAKSFAG
jgi:hypothetical protein